MTTPHSPAGDQLAAAAQQRDRSARLAAVLTVTGLALLALLLAALADYWFTLPRPARWTGLGVITVLAAVFGARLVRLWKHPTSIKEAALDFEETRHADSLEVSTAAEYATGERQVKQDYERDLVAALQQRAADTVAKNPVSYRSRIMLPALGAVGVLALLAAFAVVFPAAGTALKRAAAPWSKAAFSQIAVTPGSAEVAVGKSFAVTSQFTGRIPTKAELQVRPAGQTAWTSYPLSGATNGSFAYTFPEVKDSFAYRVTGSDAESDEFTVTAYVPPEVKDVRVRLEPPAYTRLPAAEQATADIAIVRGTTATFRVTPTVNLSKARLRFTNGVEMELKPDANQQWTAQLPVTKDNEFRFELFDGKGRKGGDELAHRITAIPDAPPKVDITEPGGDTRATATNRIALKLNASDDFGLSAMKIVYHRLGGPEQELPIAKWTSKDKDAEAEVELDLTPLKLREFELVAYHAEVRDNNTLDGPGIGRSPTYFVEITDLEGGKCLSQQAKGQKINLLVIQKQIIADTTALAANAPAYKFTELAARQHDALEFGKMYQQALTQTGAPMVAQGAMNAAVDAMTKAATALDGSKRDPALPPEESALASLYQVLKLMPELKNLPTQLPPMAKKEQPPEEQPPAVKVVLEAIKKQKKEEPNQQELAKALEDIKQLARQQSGLSTASQTPGSSPSGEPAAGESRTAPQPPQDSKDQQAKNSEPKSDQPAGKQTAKAKGKGKGKGQGKGQGQGQGQGEGEGQGQGEQAKNEAQGKPGEKPGEGTKPGEGKGKGNDPKETPDAKELAKLAPKQEEMSKEAKELSERIQRLTGKGSRLGKGAGQKMGEASAKMAQAAKAMRTGNGSGAGAMGDESTAAMAGAAAMLETLLSGRPEIGDVAAEDAPKQYEGAIADYFKRLSHAQ